MRVRGMQPGELAGVVRERLVDRAQRPAGSAWIELAGRLDVLPEADDVTAVFVRAGIEQVARRHDRRARARRVCGDVQLDRHSLRRLQRPAARDARHERQRAQVDEHVPCIAENDRVVGPGGLLRRNRDGGSDGALAHPKPYVPGKRSPRSRTSSAAGRPTTLKKSPSIRSTSDAPRPWIAYAPARPSHSREAT